MKTMFVRQVVILAWALIHSASPALAQPSPGAAFGGAAMKPGLWEVSNSMTSSDGDRRRTVTTRSCFTAGDVIDASRIVPQQRQFGMTCLARDVKASAASITWRVVCKGPQGTLHGSGSMTPGPESYSGTASLEMKSGGKVSKVEQTIKGSRVGDCP